MLSEREQAIRYVPNQPERAVHEDFVAHINGTGELLFKEHPWRFTSHNMIWTSGEFPR